MAGGSQGAGPNRLPVGHQNQVPTHRTHLQVDKRLTDLKNQGQVPQAGITSSNKS